MKYSIILLLFLKLSFVNSQSLRNYPSEKIDLQALLVWDISKSKISKVYYEVQGWNRINLSDYNDKLNFLFSKKNNLDSIFTSNDEEYMREQIATSKSFEWEGKFANARVTKKKKGVYIYTTPIFSVDRQFAILYKEKINGLENGYGCYYIYKWVLNQGWIIIKTVDCWMS